MAFRLFLLRFGKDVTVFLWDSVADGYHFLILQVFKQPWPGIMRTVYGNHERFETTYFKKFPGYYVTGDGEPWLSLSHTSH